MGEVLAFAEIVQLQRRRRARRLHGRCMEILSASVAAARAALVQASPGEWAVRVARLRKLEELAAYAGAAG